MTNEELIYLEPDEEITTIIDRLRSVDAAIIRLVVPKGGLVLQSLVSLKLLKREADRLGKDIALVTADGVGLNLGEQANITVFAKPKDTRPVFTAKTSSSALPPRKPEAKIEEITLAEDNEHASDEVQLTENEPGENVLAQPEEPEDAPTGIHVHHYIAPVVEVQSEPEVPIIEELPPSSPANAQSILAAAKKHTNSTKRPRFGRWFVFGLILAVLAAAGYLAYMELAPRAVLAVTLATEPLEMTVTLTADTSRPEVDTANARIPGVLMEAPVQIEQSVPATGKKQVGTKATATLQLYNYWDANTQSFAAGTTFTAKDSTQFISTAAATIPGATTTLKEGKVVTTPGKTNVTIEAVAVGPDANGKTGTFTIPSLAQVRQDKIYGEATTATAGGTAREVTIVSSLDLANLTNAARAAAAEKGKTSLTTDQADVHLLDGAYQFVTESEQASHEIGAEADTVSMTITGTMKGISVRDDQIRDATLAVVDKSLTVGQAHISSSSDTITTSAVNLDLAQGTVQILALIRTRTAQAFDQEKLLNTVAGQPLAAAEATLRATGGVENVQIIQKPQWLKTLPKRDDQISIKIDYRTDPADSVVPLEASPTPNE